MKMEKITKKFSDINFISISSVVEFSSYSDMKRAMDKLDGTEINGRKIKLTEDRSRRRYDKEVHFNFVDRQYRPRSDSAF